MVKCWGNNADGALGSGSTVNSESPVGVLGLPSGTLAVSAGAAHTCALAPVGISCWGFNAAGELGDTTRESRSIPVRVMGLPPEVRSVSAGGYHTCVLLFDGAVHCWGDDSYGQLGDNRSDNHGHVTGLTSDVRAIAAGEFHTCALSSDGAVKCWGRNREGQLGNAQPHEDSPIPADVVGLSAGAVAIAAGALHTCALSSTGAVECWGWSRAQNAPSEVSYLSDVVAISAGGMHACALTSVGAVKCWGANQSGQLGNGTRMSSMAPVDVVGF
jgi:alpha-tubulin suppressor-like RCC1 family protein